VAGTRPRSVADAGSLGLIAFDALSSRRRSASADIDVRLRLTQNSVGGLQSKRIGIHTRFGRKRRVQMFGGGRNTAVAIPWAVLTCLGLVTFSEEARACSWSPPGPYYIDETLDDDTPPTLTAVDLSVRRRKGNSDGANCGDIGEYTIKVEAADDQTAAGELGFAVALAEGNFPFPVPEGDVAGDLYGDLSGAFVDEGEAFQGTLEVRVVDRAGNRSEPVLVSASGDDVNSDEGCSCSAAGASPAGYGWLLPLALSLLWFRRRFFAMLRG
jgi:MYXO-CTERM domain-containing protein